MGAENPCGAGTILPRIGKTPYHRRRIPMALAEPTVRGQELGEQLRALREAAGCSLAFTGHRIDASASKICRIESGRVTATPEDVAALLTVYGTTGPRRRALLDLAREAEKRGWWQRHSPDQPSYGRTLQNQEAKASRIVTFETTVIPGLLQTSEYMRELMAGCDDLSEEEAQRCINFRQQRQGLLQERNPPHLIAIIDELVLHRPLGGREAFRRQLLHLLRAAERPNITVLVVPNNGRVHAGLTGPFVLLHKGGRPSVACVEGLTSCLFMEERFELAQYASTVQRLSDRALDEEQSAEFIASLARTNDGSELPDERPGVDPQQLQQHDQVQLR